jgi:uncharacterized membrane protein
MDNKHKVTGFLRLTSLICLSPIVLSFVLYGDLPGQIAVHWNVAGEADLYFPKWAAAFGLPMALTVFNVLTQLYLSADPKMSNVSPAMIPIRNWTICVLSVVIVPITLFIAVGHDIPIVMIALILVGTLIVIFGNYLPKSRRNYTVGIKLPWTLHDADNWNKTHLMAGRLYVVCGVAMILGTFILRAHYLPLALLVAIELVVIVLVPIVYSYRLFRKGDTQESRGTRT